MKELRMRRLANDVLSSVGEARSFNIWCQAFPGPDNLEDAWAIGGQHEHITNAVLMYSFLALRRLNEFLKSGPGRSNDVRCDDFGLDRLTILDGADSLLLNSELKMVDKQIVHHTDSGLADSDVEGDYIFILDRVDPILDRLEAEINALTIFEVH